MGRITPELSEDCLRDLARELVSAISALDPPRSRELISGFLFEMAGAAAELNRREERRRKQAEGIAAAQARGVRFGRPSSPLPDTFDESYRAWREGAMTIREAANACGMRKTTFENAVLRRERSPETALEANA